MMPLYLIMNSNLLIRNISRLPVKLCTPHFQRSLAFRVPPLSPTPYARAYFCTNKDSDNPQKGPGKDPKKNSLSEQFQQKLNELNEYLDYLYKKRWSAQSIAGACLLAIWLSFFLADSKDQELSTKEFISLMDTNSFQKVTFVEEEFFYSKNISAKRVEGQINSQVFYCYVDSFDLLMEKAMSNPELSYTNKKIQGLDFFLQRFYIVMDTVSLFLIFGLIFYSSKNSAGKGASGGMGQMMGVSKKTFEVAKDINIKFDDVAGLHEVKREVQEVVDFLKFPERYTSLGATIPRGVLLTGPPGTGKTLLAKACAGEAGVPFYSVSGSDFVEMYVGVGASRVRDLFSSAKQAEKAAIIFIDELDAIGKKRSNNIGGNDERQSTLNQLLVEMDGFEGNNKVVVMGATNRKQILDPALVRPGRFDREVEVNLPDLKGRFEIFLVHLRPLKLSNKYTKEEYGRRLASLTPGFSGAEIANLCNEAAILSARQGKQVVQMIDFELSSERVIGGVERKGFVSIEEKKTVAFHECGHAVVSWFLEGADPLLKVTIIPRSKGALGFAQYFVNENQLQTKQELLDRICFILGGRCAELHFFKEVTTGAYDDLSKAYDLAYTMITKYGMSSQIGYLSYPDSQYTKAFSEKVEAAVDVEVQKIIKECTAITMRMVAQYEDLIRNFAEQLLIKETMDVTSIEKILGKRPFPPNKTFEAYLETSNQF